MYEFVAPPNFSTKQALNPTYFFIIETSYQSVNYGKVEYKNNSKGLLHQVLNSIRVALDYFENAGNTSIGFMTFNSTMQFYTAPTELPGEPNVRFKWLIKLQVSYVSDVNEPFIPFPKSKLLYNLESQRDEVNHFGWIFDVDFV